MNPSISFVFGIFLIALAATVFSGTEMQAPFAIAGVINLVISTIITYLQYKKEVN